MIGPKDAGQGQDTVIVDLLSVRRTPGYHSTPEIQPPQLAIHVEGRQHRFALVDAR